MVSLMKVPCNCDTGERSGRQVHDPACAGIPSLYGAWMSEYTCREWMKEQQEIISALKSALESIFAKEDCTCTIPGAEDSEGVYCDDPVHAQIRAALAVARGVRRVSVGIQRIEGVPINSRMKERLAVRIASIAEQLPESMVILGDAMAKIKSDFPAGPARNERYTKYLLTLPDGNLLRIAEGLVAYKPDLRKMLLEDIGR
jgi:hypothetical protein